MKKIPFSPPDITDAEIAEVVDALKSGWITTGPKTKLLEKRLAAFIETGKVDIDVSDDRWNNRVVCLNSNTACSEMTLRILGVGKGDEVIVPAYTYTASASVIDHVGAKIVMVDCEQGKYTMDYDALEAAITEKTKVIIPVDLFGIPCDYDRIFDIVERKKSLFKASDNPIQKAFNRIIVMADAAHALGATWHNKSVGNIADFTNYSFHAVKNLTTAEGGAVTWKSIPGVDNEELYKMYQLYSLHGQNKDALAKTKLGAWEYDIKGLWFKCNMTDTHAAIGLAQSQRYDKILERRKRIIERYNEAFKDLPVTPVVHYTDEYQSSGHLYIMNLIGYTSEQRNEFIEKMAEMGVATNVHYKPLPMHTGYQKLGFDIKDYPNAYKQYENEVTLPLHTCLTDEDVEYVIECVRKILC